MPEFLITANKASKTGLSEIILEEIVQIFRLKKLFLMLDFYILMMIKICCAGKTKAKLCRIYVFCQL